jgi:chemotaxis protein MotB
MSLRSVFLLSLTVLFLGTSGCATRYQDLLRDRDAEIRDLESKLANSRADNEDLRRKLDDARAVQVAPAAAPSGDGELAKVQGDLPDLDVRRSRGRISIGIENTVTFDAGSTGLKSGANSMLRRVADVLKRDYADRRIYVEGHTDTDPINKTRGQFRSNRHLSAERADAVARWLVQNAGIPERQIAVVGYGPFDPRDPGNSDQAKAKNRRVEIVVGEAY